MTAAAWFQLALGLLRLVNWITTQVDRRQWEASGYAKAMAEQQAAIAKNIGLADQAYTQAEAMTEEERRKVLKD